MRNVVSERKQPLTVLAVAACELVSDADELRAVSDFVLRERRPLMSSRQQLHTSVHVFCFAI